MSKQRRIETSIQIAMDSLEALTISYEGHSRYNLSYIHVIKHKDASSSGSIKPLKYKTTFRCIFLLNKCKFSFLKVTSLCKKMRRLLEIHPALDTGNLQRISVHELTAQKLI